jgi:hypothetical protein
LINALRTSWRYANILRTVSFAFSIASSLTRADPTTANSRAYVNFV